MSGDRRHNWLEDRTATASRPNIEIGEEEEGGGVGWGGGWEGCVIRVALVFCVARFFFVFCFSFYLFFL